MEEIDRSQVNVDSDEFSSDLLALNKVLQTNPVRNWNLSPHSTYQQGQSCDEGWTRLMVEYLHHANHQQHIHRISPHRINQWNCSEWKSILIPFTSIDGTLLCWSSYKNSPSKRESWLLLMSDDEERDSEDYESILSQRFSFHRIAIMTKRASCVELIETAQLNNHESILSFIRFENTTRTCNSYRILMNLDEITVISPAHVHSVVTTRESLVSEIPMNVSSLEVDSHAGRENKSGHMSKNHEKGIPNSNSIDFVVEERRQWDQILPQLTQQWNSEWSSEIVRHTLTKKKKKSNHTMNSVVLIEQKSQVLVTLQNNVMERKFFKSTRDIIPAASARNGGSASMFGDDVNLNSTPSVKPSPWPSFPGVKSFDNTSKFGADRNGQDDGFSLDSPAPIASGSAAKAWPKLPASVATSIAKQTSFGGGSSSHFRSSGASLFGSSINKNSGHDMFSSSSLDLFGNGGVSRALSTDSRSALSKVAGDLAHSSINRVSIGGLMTKSIDLAEWPDKGSVKKRDAPLSPNNDFQMNQGIQKWSRSSDGFMRPIFHEDRGISDDIGKKEETELEDSGDLNENERRNTRTDAKKEFECILCHKMYPRKTNLMRHIQMVHEKTKPFKCEQCGDAFGTESNLRRHIRGKHLQMRPYSCARCEQKFVQSSDLKRHTDRRHPYSSYAESPL